MTAKEQKKATADFVAKRVGKKYGEGILERSLFARINPTVKLLLLLVFGIHPFVRCAAEIPVLSSENDFAQWVETNRTCEAISAPLFPPGMTRAGIHLGIIGFNSDSLRELSNLPAETRFDIPVRRVYLCETGAADRVWVVRDANGVPIQEFVEGTDVWELYHCREGELHCGSEADRRIPSNPDFWTAFPNWPFKDSK